MPNGKAAWHAACVAAWKFWIAPHEQVRVLKRHQGHRCKASGKRLLRTAEVDHAVPLYRVWRDTATRPGRSCSATGCAEPAGGQPDRPRPEMPGRGAERSQTLRLSRYRVVEDESGFFSVVEEE